MFLVSFMSSRLLLVCVCLAAGVRGALLPSWPAAVYTSSPKVAPLTAPFNAAVNQPAGGSAVGALKAPLVSISHHHDRPQSSTGNIAHLCPDVFMPPLPPPSF